MTSSVEITAPSRLHFGMFSFGHTDRPQFGGVGVMIDRPGLRVSVRPAKQLSASGPLAERALDFARRWEQASELDLPLRCHIEIENAPPQHVGLGVGTQLGMSIAAGLCDLHSREQPNAVSLAMRVGRGLRSAVGIYGFQQGGLIVERGKLPGEPISPLVARCEVPSAWRFVLLRPELPGGLSGGDEQRAFASLPPVPLEVTDELWREVNAQMLPALQAANFQLFSEAVLRFGKVAGECFSSVQGGPYNGPVLHELVEKVRELGVAGVGQSSWGPTLFCLLPSQADAEQFVPDFQNLLGDVRVHCTIAGPCNCGATTIMRTS
jgi:beta-RFAP synthase